MRVGLDYRTVGTSPQSGISRQVYALESALHTLPNIEVERFTVAPLGDETRLWAHCPAWGCAKTAMHQPQNRLRFEAGFLPRTPCRSVHQHLQYGPAVATQASRTAHRRAVA